MWVSRAALLVGLLVTAAGACAQSQDAGLQQALENARRQSSDRDYTAALDTLHGAAPLARTPGERATLSNASGWTNFLAGDTTAAIQDLRGALAYAESAGDAAIRLKILNNLGVLYFTRGDTTHAEPYFTEAAALDSDTARRFLEVIAAQKHAEHVQNLIAAGAAQRRAKDFRGAIAYYDQALDEQPGNVQALAYRGYAEFRAGELDKARSTLEQAGRIDLDHGFVALNLMKVYCAQEDALALASLLAQDAAKTSDGAIEGYWRKDGELRRVCRNQGVLRQTTAAIGPDELN